MDAMQLWVVLIVDMQPRVAFVINTGWLCSELVFKVTAQGKQLRIELTQ